jgi:hypothetical protein
MDEEPKVDKKCIHHLFGLYNLLYVRFGIFDINHTLCVALETMS